MPIPWMKVFRIIPIFRILRLTFYGKSEKVRLKIMNWQIIITSDLFSDYLKITDLLNFFILNILLGMLQVFRIELSLAFWKF